MVAAVLVVQGTAVLLVVQEIAVLVVRGTTAVVVMVLMTASLFACFVFISPLTLVLRAGLKEICLRIPAM